MGTFGFTFTGWCKLILPNKCSQKHRGKLQWALSWSPFLPVRKQVPRHATVVGTFLDINPQGWWLSSPVYKQIMFTVKLQAGGQAQEWIPAASATSKGWTDVYWHNENGWRNTEVSLLFSETRSFLLLLPCATQHVLPFMCYCVYSHTIWQVDITITILQKERYSPKPYS